MVNHHLATLGLVLAASLAAPSVLGYEKNDDPFGDYEFIEYVSGAIGAVMHEGSLGEEFGTGPGVALRIGHKVVPAFSMVSTLGAVIASSKTSSRQDKLYYDLGMRGQLKLARFDRMVVPYLEIGIGISGLRGPTFEWLAGMGVDLKVWGDDALGVQAFFHHLPTESASIIPTMLTFTHFF
jgi:hypothetical protein